MNTYYDLIVYPDYSARISNVRAEVEASLREWFDRHNAEKEHSIILSNQLWVGDQYTQIMRCKTEYVAFEGRLLFGAVFARVQVTEQEDGPYIFKPELYK